MEYTVDLSPLLAGEMKTVSFDFKTREEDLHDDLYDCELHSVGEINNYSGYFVLTASTTLCGKSRCARCDRGFSYHSTFEFEVKLKVFDEKPDRDDLEYFPIEDGKADVGRALRDQLIMDLPARFLCSGDCKGLCPKCGCDLNESTCGCDTKDIDPRLMVLKDFFNEN